MIWFYNIFLNHIQYTHVLSEDVKYRRWKTHLTLKRNTNSINTKAGDVNNSMEKGEKNGVNASNLLRNISRQILSKKEDSDVSVLLCGQSYSNSNRSHFCGL